MGWFEAFRGDQGYTWYGDRRTPALIDIPLAAVTYFCTLVAIATVIASLGIRGKDKWGTVVRSFYGVAVGSIILVSLYGQCWLKGEVDITSTYIYRSRDLFTGEVGIQVGLHGANVTLRGYFGELGRRGEVTYSEALPWPDFGKEEENLSVYLYRGLPDPILRVAEYLCTDAGGLRWGRTFHTSGYLACSLLWTAFAFWIVTNILLFSVIVYGAYMLILTGSAMLLASIVYHVLQPTQSLEIAFDDVILTTSYGWCFWLTLFTGAITVVIGVVLLLLDNFIPKKIADFFRVETSIGDDERFESENDLSRQSSAFSMMEKRGSIFQTLQSRRTSIFSDVSSRRSSIYTNGWFTGNKAFASDSRSQSAPRLFGYDNRGIIEEDENETLDNLDEVHIGIDQDSDSTSCSVKMSSVDSDNRVNDLNEKQMSVQSLRSCLDNRTLEITTINVTGGRSRQNSSDSGNCGSERNRNSDAHSLSSCGGN